MKKVKVLLFWLRRNEGGRVQPPHGKKYSTVIRFCSRGSDGDSSAWSVVLELGSLNQPCLTMFAEMSFLAKQAPSDALQDGFPFEITEGDRVVAKGVVVGT